MADLKVKPISPCRSQTGLSLNIYLPEKVQNTMNYRFLYTKLFYSDELVMFVALVDTSLY